MLEQAPFNIPAKVIAIGKRQNPKPEIQLFEMQCHARSLRFPCIRCVDTSVNKNCVKYFVRAFSHNLKIYN